MSWNISLGITEKKDAEWQLDKLTLITLSNNSTYAHDQLAAAKRAAKEILKTIPGPYVSVYLTGHANGVGWQKKEGCANETITASVTQWTEDDEKRFSDEDRMRIGKFVKADAEEGK
jgi:hypothetical protein